jgi:hypothetical protein
LAGFWGLLIQYVQQVERNPAGMEPENMKLRILNTRIVTEEKVRMTLTKEEEWTGERAFHRAFRRNDF